MNELDLLATQRNAILDGARAVGIEIELAELLADQVESRVRQAHGGTTCYVYTPSKTERNRQIREAYRRGVGITMLALRYQLSESRVRQIVAITLVREH
jgi:Mor family transcriptional regulator